MNPYIQPNIRFDWEVTYEIPPLRAIYTAKFELMRKDEVESEIAEKNPPWRVMELKPTLPNLNTP